MTLVCQDLYSLLHYLGYERILGLIIDKKWSLEARGWHFLALKKNCLKTKKRSSKIGYNGARMVKTQIHIMQPLLWESFSKEIQNAAYGISDLFDICTIRGGHWLSSAWYFSCVSQANYVNSQPICLVDKKRYIKVEGDILLYI